MKPVPKVQLRNVNLSYHTLEGETVALRNVNFSVAQQEFICIVGPSGCGKSTILSLIAGLLKPSSGEVLVDGQPVEGVSTKVGYMLQQDYLFEWRTILDNALLGLEVRGQHKDPEAVERVRYLLKKYGLGGFERHYPNQLSGGMRQRVALIRTLAVAPDILLLDEPFSALDYQTRLALEEEIGTILREEAKTVILVTHDISEAISMGDRIIVMTRRPGTVKADYQIILENQHASPLQRREDPRFREYFRTIWKELDKNA